jgi:3-phenylpropionate/trans-cinnamate dioxygenase ferredoxin component
MTEPSTGGFRSVAATAEVANDTVVPRYVRERKVRVSIARVDGRLYAFDDLCTCGHEPCPLSGGLLTGRTVMCQCHGSRFDITTGAVLNGPATRPLNVYDVHETDGSVEIRA